MLSSYSQIGQYSVFVMVKGDQLGFVFITFISYKWNPFQWMCLVNDVFRNHLFLECVLYYVYIMNAVPHCIKWIAMNMVWINYGYTNKYKNRTMYIYISVLENLQCYNVILTEVKSSHLKTESNFDNQLLNHFEL